MEQLASDVGSNATTTNTNGGGSCKDDVDNLAADNLAADNLAADINNVANQDDAADEGVDVFPDPVIHHHGRHDDDVFTSPKRIRQQHHELAGLLASLTESQTQELWAQLGELREETIKFRNVQLELERCAELVSEIMAKIYRLEVTVHATVQAAIEGVGDSYKAMTTAPFSVRTWRGQDGAD